MGAEASERSLRVTLSVSLSGALLLPRPLDWRRLLLLLLLWARDWGWEVFSVSACESPPFCVSFCGVELEEFLEASLRGVRFADWACFSEDWALMSPEPAAEAEPEAFAPAVAWDSSVLVCSSAILDWEPFAGVSGGVCIQGLYEGVTRFAIICRVR